MSMRTYISMLRVVFSARSDEHAKRTASWFKEHLEQVTEPRDDVSVTQVTAYGDDLAPDENINVLKHARNILIRLKYKDTMYIAEELDKRICLLQLRMLDEDAHAPNYDYNRIDTIMKLLDAGEDPLL
jgi:hypothetical protein